MSTPSTVQGRDPALLLVILLTFQLPGFLRGDPIVGVFLESESRRLLRFALSFLTNGLSVASEPAVMPSLWSARQLCSAVDGGNEN